MATVYLRLKHRCLVWRASATRNDHRWRLFTLYAAGTSVHRSSTCGPHQWYDGMLLTAGGGVYRFVDFLAVIITSSPRAVWIRKRSLAEIGLTSMELAVMSLSPAFLIAAENPLNRICWRSFVYHAQIIARMMIKSRTPPCLLANCIVDVIDVILGTGTTGRRHHQLVYRSLQNRHRY